MVILAVNPYLLQIFFFFFEQYDRWFDTNIYLGLVGRFFFVLSFIAYHKVISVDRKSPYNAVGWVKFFIREVFYVIISIPIDFVAMGILGYSVLQSAQLLRARTEKKHYLCRFFGFLFSPIIFVLGSIGLLGFSIFGRSNEALLYDFYGLVASGLIFVIMRHGFPKAQNLLNFLNFERKSLWMKVPKVLKVVGLLCLVTSPLIFIYLVNTQILPKSDDYMVEMADGTQLLTRVYYTQDTSDSNPKPVILYRTPYNINNAEIMTGTVVNYVTMQGYVLVAQDIRGTGGSEGEFYGFFSDYSDGNDTVNWVMSQTWCNKKIMSIGGSALGITQLMYHSALNNIQNPNLGLRAASIVVGTADMYEYCIFPGGCFQQNLSEDWLHGVGGDEAIPKILAHPMKDSFWDNVSLSANNKYQNIDVRAVHVGGWYDLFQQGTIQGFELYNQGTTYAQDHQFLVMGPWSHGLSNKHLDVTYPTANYSNFIGDLEYILREEYFNSNPTICNWGTRPNVYYYVMGDPEGIGSTTTYNHWRTSMTWPIASTPEQWYLHPNGTFSPNAPDSSYNMTYLYDPRDPVRNGGGGTLVAEYIGAVDQRRVEYSNYYTRNYHGTFDTSQNRSDILKFKTAVLEAPVELVGNLTAELYIGSNCTDTDFTAKLIDVYPDGKEIFVTEGIVKTRYRNGFTSEAFLSENSLYKITIDMWSTAYRFVPGHKIQISISSSNWDKYSVNPNTGGAVNNTHPSDCTPGNYYIANNTVSCGDPVSLSCIWFPRTV
jgi:predicted acyl esterase